MSSVLRITWILSASLLAFFLHIEALSLAEAQEGPVAPDDIQCPVHPCPDHGYVVLYNVEDGSIEALVGYDVSSPDAVPPESIFRVGEGQATLVLEAGPIVADIMNNSAGDNYRVDVSEQRIVAFGGEDKGSEDASRDSVARTGSGDSSLWSLLLPGLALVATLGLSASVVTAARRRRRHE